MMRQLILGIALLFVSANMSGAQTPAEDKVIAALKNDKL